MADKELKITPNTYIFAGVGAVILGILANIALGGMQNTIAAGVVGGIAGGALGLFFDSRIEPTPDCASAQFFSQSFREGELLHDPAPARESCFRVAIARESLGSGWRGETVGCATCAPRRLGSSDRREVGHDYAGSSCH